MGVECLRVYNARVKQTKVAQCWPEAVAHDGSLPVHVAQQLCTRSFCGEGGGKFVEVVEGDAGDVGEGV